MIDSGAAATLRFTVTEADTALAVGSGSLPVLGTPRLVAWMEAATCAAVEARLDPGTTTVGTRVEVSHRAPSPVGATVEVSATVAEVAGRAVRFAVEARHGNGTVVGDGEIHRAVVDATRLLDRLGSA